MKHCQLKTEATQADYRALPRPCVPVRPRIRTGGSKRVDEADVTSEVDARPVTELAVLMCDQCDLGGDKGHPSS